MVINEAVWLKWLAAPPLVLWISWFDGQGADLCERCDEAAAQGIRRVFPELDTADRLTTASLLLTAFPPTSGWAWLCGYRGAIVAVRRRREHHPFSKWLTAIQSCRPLPSGLGHHSPGEVGIWDYALRLHGLTGLSASPRAAIVEKAAQPGDVC